MPTRIHTEQAFENAIEATLLSPESGWQKGLADNFNRALALDGKEITLLQEYRQALIFEAVTGKIDVREAA